MTPQTTAPDSPVYTDTPDAPAWSEADLRDDPHAKADKAKRVRDMFAAIAGRYDLNNRLHSFGRDQAWRRTAVKLAQLQPGDRVLDVACGTGDLTLAFRNALHSAKYRNNFVGLDSTERHGQAIFDVVGLDFTFEMLPLAERKNYIAPPAGVEPHAIGFADGCHFLNADAMALPFPDQTFDVVSIAFGLRNVADPDAAVAEFGRVLRPGGRLVVLEFSQPRNPVLRWGSRLYTERIMPRTATWIAGDRSGAYRYLPRSVATFLDREGMAVLLARHGLTGFHAKPLSLGIATVYVAQRP